MLISNFRQVETPAEQAARDAADTRRRAECERMCCRLSAAPIGERPETGPLVRSVRLVVDSDTPEETLDRYAEAMPGGSVAVTRDRWGRRVITWERW